MGESVRVARADDPRGRLLQLGPERLSDAELLAVVLRTGVEDCTAVNLGAQLLARFGGLAGVLDAPAAHLLACLLYTSPSPRD